MREDKKIEIEMKDQISEAINWYGENISEKPVTPANKKFFNIDHTSKNLNEEKSDIFHSVVAKLLLYNQKSKTRYRNCSFLSLYTCIKKY